MLKLVLIPFFTCCFFFTVRGQQFIFQKYSTAEGLIQSQPRSVVQDSFGRLWIGTMGGLSCYNGSAFINYTRRHGLTNNFIFSQCFDRKGNLWIGTVRGMCVYRSGTFSKVMSIPDKIIAAIQTDDEGRVWSLAGGKLYQLRDSTFQLFALDTNRITALQKDKSGILWVFSKSGSVFYLQSSVWKKFQPFGFSGIGVKQIERTGSNQFTVLTGAGVFQYTRGIKKILVPEDSSHLFTCMNIQTDGSFWLGGIKGAWYWERGVLSHIDRQSGFIDEQVVKIFTDREKQLWFATDGSGLYSYSSPGIRIINEKQGLKTNMIFSMIKDQNDLLIGSYGALYRFTESGLHSMQEKLFKKINITVVLPRRDDHLLGTGDRGVFSYRRGRIIPVSPEVMSAVSVTQMIKDSGQKIWVGSQQGLFVLNAGDTAEKVTEVKAAVSSLYRIRDSLLIGAQGCLIIMNTQTRQIRTVKTPFFEGTHITSITQKGNFVFLGTDGIGLILWDRKYHTFTSLNASNGLPSDYVYSLWAEEPFVWIGTGRGIVRLAMYNNQPSVHTLSSQKTLAVECNQNGVYTDSNFVWFATGSGIVRIEKKKYSYVSSRPRIFLTSIKTDKRQIFSVDSSSPVKPVSGQTFSFKENMISFEFNSFSIRQPENIFYQYRLVGADTQFSAPSPKNFVVFSGLAAGNYVLEIVAVDQSTRRRSDLLQYRFFVQPPFYKTLWFLLLLTGVLIGCGVLVNSLFHQSRRKRKRMLKKLREEEMRNLRQQTSEDFHDELGNKITRIVVLTDVLSKKTENRIPEYFRIAQQLKENALTLYSSTREVIWALDPKNDNLYELLIRMRESLSDTFEETEIQYSFPEIDPFYKKFKLSIDYGRNLSMIFKEVLSNILKHAQAEEVCVKLEVQEDLMTIIISDNGIGFNPTDARKGYGLNNMQKRAQRIKGSLDIVSNERGTETSVSFNLHNAAPL